MKKQLLLLFVSILFSVNNYSQTSFITQDTDCNTGCSDLTIDFNNVYGTSDYTVESISFNPPTSFNGLPNSLSGADDQWSNEINIPFDFSFFGNIYSSLLISGNGGITFEIENAGSYHAWNFAEELPNNTNNAFGQANIFGAMHDMDPAVQNISEISWGVIGQAPNRIVAISYYNMPQFGCNNLATTQMVVLHETTNIIEMFIQEKPLCVTWNNGSAVLGIQNIEGTEAVVPPGRNTGQWEATNEAWRFNPAGAGFENEYAWYDLNGTVISTDTSINVCPTVDETYTAEVTYYNLSIGDYETTTETITVLADIVGQEPNDLEICGQPAGFDIFNLTTQTNVITGGNTCSIVSYYQSLEDAQNDTNVINNAEGYSNITNPETIYVRIEDSATGSYETTMFDLIVSTLPQANSSELVICASNNGTATFTLSDMDMEVTNGNSDYSVSYYASFSDAENETNILPETYENTNNPQVIYGRVNSSENACFSIVECYLNVDNGIELNNIGNLVECGTNGVSSFDLVTHVNQFINANITAELTFYISQEDAENESNLIFPANNYLNTSNPQIIFVRAQDVNSGCFSYGSFEINVEDATNINAPTPFTICDLDGAEDGFYVFDLNQKDAEILDGLGSNSYSVTYYATQEEAETEMNPLNASEYYNTTQNIQTVFVRVENLNVGCVSFTTLDLIVEICQVACQESETFCYGNDSNIEYTYTNDNGSPLTVVFNSGQMETCCDVIVVRDSDNVILYEGNNNGDLSGLTFTSTGDTITIIVESDGSVSCETNNYEPIDFQVYCIAENGAIEVNAFIDENSDTVFDASEVNFSNGEFSYEVNNDGVTNYVNSSSGSFIIPNPQEGDTYDITFTMFEEYNTCLAQTFTLVEDVVPSQTEVIQVNFPLTSISNCSDIAVYLSANAPPRPGVLYSNNLIIENLGSLPVSGSVEFTNDATVSLDNVYNVDSGNSVTNTATGFIFDFNNLAPGATEQVYIELNIPTNLNIGDLVTNSAVYNASDINLDNNESILTQEVVNSYDPNNKLESHGPEIKLDEFTNEDYLYYTINFQNLGTAEALDIRVEDVLNAQLDATTFKMLNASHDYMVTRVDNNLIWEFEDINLPSESMDEPSSHGYVYFKIKPLAGYEEGDIIPNVADIYFDFNPAITTNIFETKFVTSLSVDEFSTTGYSMYPNPASSTVHVQFNTVITENTIVSIYNIQGKLIDTPSTISSDNKINFNISSLSKGMYFVEIKGNSFKVVEKLIVE